MLMNADAHAGKTTFFVANQEKLEDVSAEKLADLEKEHKIIEEENKTLAAEVRTLSTGTLIHIRNRVPKSYIHMLQNSQNSGLRLQTKLWHSRLRRPCPR